MDENCKEKLPGKMSKSIRRLWASAKMAEEGRKFQSNNCASIKIKINHWMPYLRQVRKHHNLLGIFFSPRFAQIWGETVARHFLDYLDPCLKLYVRDSVEDGSTEQGTPGPEHLTIHKTLTISPDPSPATWTLFTEIVKSNDSYPRVINWDIPKANRK